MNGQARRSGATRIPVVRQPGECIVLEAFGIPPEAETVYLTGLGQLDATAESIARSLAVDVDEVHRHVLLLTAHSLVSSDPEGVLRFVPPELAFQQLSSAEEERMSRRRTAIAAARDSIGDLIEHYLQPRRVMQSAFEVEELRDAATVRSRLVQLTEGAAVSVRSMVPGPAFDPQATSASEQLDRSLLERGVEVYLITSRAALADASWNDYVQRIAARGAHVRVHPSPPLLMVAIDDDTVVLPVDDSQGASVIRSAAAALPALRLFDMTWAASAVVSASPDSEAGEWLDEIGPRARQVLDLLSQGFTDEMIGRRIGLSDRSVRRLVARICQELHANSRFQAGVQAARTGLLGQSEPPVT